MTLDTIGGNYAQRSLRTLRLGGALISVSSPLEPGGDVVAQARERAIRTGFTLVEPDRARLLALFELIDERKLRPHVAEVLPLAEAARAHELGETGRTTGKLVLAVR